MQVLILPGYGNSGPDHWQSHWEAAYPGMARIHQKDWEKPRRHEWLQTIEQSVATADSPVILVAHSLACLAVVHWGQAQEAPQARLGLHAKVHAALLVAPPNPQATAFPPTAADFGPVPSRPLAFSALLAFSSNDPYATPSFALDCAQAWQCRSISVGALGHINSESRLGLWPQGFALLQSLGYQGVPNSSIDS